MKILGHYKHAWPVQRGGSEVAAHRVLKWLAARGHEVTVAVTAQKARPADGVNYVTATDRRVQRSLWEQADVVMAHQAATVEAGPLAKATGRRVFHWAHNNSWFPSFSEHLSPGRDTVLWNSYALAAMPASQTWEGDGMVLHPPVFADEYEYSYGDAILQVNLSRIKGGETFWSLALDNPDIPFLGIVGGWGSQLDERGVEHHFKHAVKPLMSQSRQHVSIIDSTEDMAGEVYPRAKAIIIPTQRVTQHQVGESGGLVAAEAICCGVVPIATDSVGMRELVGDAGLLISDPHDLAEWQAAIDVVKSEAEYPALRRTVLDRRKSLDPTAELEALEAALLAASGDQEVYL